ncbi:MAG TPA: hypothetical protein VKA86_11535 [Candidatus Krumholzibacteria bacterium]|nr:hypothetical protein [Candidatus Krumholzibacteria bacterium]
MIRDVETLSPPPVHNRLHHAAGLALLALNSVRHRVLGYRTPRPQSAADADETLHYDRAVFENWVQHLRDYLQRDPILPGHAVLEIGPGPDLGTGLLWLAAGAESYTAIDAHRLVPSRRAGELHRALAAGIAGQDVELLDRLHDAIDALEAGDPDSPLRYRVIENFDLGRLPKDRYDLVVSHSALEHLSQVGTSFAQLSDAVTDRAHLVAEIDLQTHTRWIRDHDPLNIYRYSRKLYRSLGFSGIPNRVRPDDYLAHLERSGWYDLRVYPRRVLEIDYVRQVEPTLAPRYRGDLEQLAWMSIVLCASRRGERSWRKPAA